MSQSNTGSLSGKVQGFESGEMLSKVLIRLEGTNKSALTNNEGIFFFKDLAAGKYIVVCMRSDRFSTRSDPVEVIPGEDTDIELKMLKGDPDQYCYFSIGGITVTAEKDLIPESHETVHKISSGEIEHMQATNLGDILELIPGADIRNRPGLYNQIHASMRGAEQVLDEIPDIFGTRVIVDDIPLSNNANLNAGVGVGYASVKGNVTNGVDLRTLPADNVQEVDVVTGVPSVQYGDVTSGIVKVRTRSDAEPLRLKIKNNPDTKEFNFGGGFNLGSHTTVNLNANDAYSLRDLRIDGDEVNRLSFQGVFSHNLLNKKLILSEKVSFTRMFEDYALKDDSLATAAYNHDLYWGFGQSIRYHFSKNTSLYYRGFLNVTRRKSYKRQRYFIDPVYATDLFDSGTQVAKLLMAGYTWEVNTTGLEYNAGAKLNFNHRIVGNGMVHNILFGSEFLYEANTGEGKQFDPLLPPNGLVGKRPYSFDQVPGFRQLSLYAEDRISGKLFRPYTLTLGMRAEMYNPKSFGGRSLIKSRNGTFWNPRTGLQIRLNPNLQLRGSFGISSKAPALYQMYPGPVYYDVLEPGNYVAGGDTVRLISTYPLDVSNDDLKGYTQRKIELGTDFKFNGAGISVTGFLQKTRNAPAMVQLPYIRYTYAYPNWPSTEGKYLSGADSVQNLRYSEYVKMANLGWIDRRGAEISLRTHRIKSLNMRFRVGGLFSSARSGREPSVSVRSPRGVLDSSAASGPVVRNIFPIYPSLNRREKKLVLNYSLDYMNETLGIWLTFTMYHQLYQQNVVSDWPSDYQLATGYYEEGNYYTLTPEQAREWGLSSHVSTVERMVYTFPVRYYFNLTVSKNIYQGMEVSLFVNNFLNSRQYYTNYMGQTVAANPEIFYGIEFSMMVKPFSKLFSQKVF